MKTLMKCIFLIACVWAFISCSLDEFYTPGSTDTRSIQFIARPTSFTGYTVRTKASNSLAEMENRVSSAYFLAFNKDGNRFVFDDLTDRIQSNAVPTINLRSDLRTELVTVCYLVNVSYEFASSIETIDDLNNPLNITYADPVQAGAIGVPLLTCSKHNIETCCIPMFSVKTVNLPTDETSFTMELKRSFAKMDVELSMNLEGDDEDHKTKFFNLMEYSVINLPNKVMLIDPAEGIDTLATAVMEPSGWGPSDMEDPVVTDRLFEGEATFGQNEGVSFSFYTPEHFVIPAVSPDDVIPTSTKPEERQKYKPLLVEGQNATLLRLKGLYGEGEEDLVKTLTYDIYLGRNNSDDFCIFRNFRYNNKIRIIDTQNFKDGGDLGIDHRVNLETKGFLVGFKRATLLDAHYEVRPMRIRFPNNPVPGKVTVEILKEDKTPASPDEMSWIRVERPKSSDRTSSSATYYTTGKRKYFTANLVTSDLKNNVKIEYNPYHTSEGDLYGHIPIWVYVDEYSVAATDNDVNKNRKAILRVTFTPDNITEDNGIVSQSFTVQQRAMYPISHGGRNYNIEYFEEYLYDFDGQENYGEEGGEYVGGDGVVWGMNGTQLSHIHQSMFINSEATGLWESLIEGAMNLTLSSISPLYDFYLSRDIPESVYNPRKNINIEFTEEDKQGIAVRDYSGVEFNLEAIISQKINNGSNMALNDAISSAIEYCYKKNKAATSQKDAVYVESTSGVLNRTTYNTSNFKWFLPAIDEMEDLIMGGKDIPFFNEVFTKSWYWSCQSAFNRYYLYYSIVMDYLISKDEDQRVGEYYLEDIYSARATKLDKNVFISSDSNGYTGFKSLFYLSTRAWDYVDIEDTSSPLDLYHWVYERRQTGTTGGWWPRPTYETKWWQDDKIHTFPYEADDAGVHARGVKNRVRCIYNPNPPKQVIVSGSGDDIQYEYKY